MSLDNGIYTALSRQTGLFRKMEAIAQNVANANTVGYKSEAVVFRDFMEFQGKKRDALAMAQDYRTVRDSSQGPGQVTGNQLDFMINGDGYFTVEAPQGQMYTRAGNFQVDAEGTLVTAQGYPVLGAGGARIEFQPTDTTVELKGDGTIIANGEERGQLQVVTFENEDTLKKAGDNLYSSATDAQPKDTPNIAQGVLESSNVQGVVEITRMIETVRQTGSVSRIIDDSYEMQRKAISVFGKRLN